MSSHLTRIKGQESPPASSPACPEPLHSLSFPSHAILGGRTSCHSFYKSLHQGILTSVSELLRNQMSVSCASRGPMKC